MRPLGILVDMRFENKVAVVTGAGRGIGLAIAERLASEGAAVAVVSRSEANAQAAVAKLNGGGEAKARAYAVDVADPEAVQQMTTRILEDFGRVDILVNNAGITRDTLAMRMSEEEWSAVIATNLSGAFHVTQGFLRSMLKQRSGRIINISSVIGLIGNAGQANYAASKAGLIGLTKSLAKECASRGILVNAIAPGFIVTDMTDVLPEEVKSAVLKQIPLGRLGAVQDIASAAAFLASDEAGYITGQVLTVDGGMVM